MQVSAAAAGAGIAARGGASRAVADEIVRFMSSASPPVARLATRPHRRLGRAHHSIGFAGTHVFALTRGSATHVFDSAPRAAKRQSADTHLQVRLTTNLRDRAPCNPQVSPKGNLQVCIWRIGGGREPRGGAKRE